MTHTSGGTHKLKCITQYRLTCYWVSTQARECIVHPCFSFPTIMIWRRNPITKRTPRLSTTLPISKFTASGAGYMLPWAAYPESKNYFPTASLTRPFLDRQPHSLSCHWVTVYQKCANTVKTADEDCSWSEWFGNLIRVTMLVLEYRCESSSHSKVQTFSTLQFFQGLGSFYQFYSYKSRSQNQCCLQ